MLRQNMDELVYECLYPLERENRLVESFKSNKVV